VLYREHVGVCYIENMLIYDDVDEEVLRSFHEMSLANLIFYAMKEGACSEQSSRMTAMEAASKNAGTFICSPGLLEGALSSSYGILNPLFTDSICRLTTVGTN